MESNEINLEARDCVQQADILAKAGNAEAAEAKFLQAIDIEPMEKDAYKGLGDLYASQGRYQDAKNYFKKALLIEKEGSVYFQYGNVCFMNDEPHEGLEAYNRALSYGFDSDEMFFFMALAYEHMNDDRMALRYVQKALSKNPSRPDYKIKKVSILLRLGMNDEAKETVDDILINDPELFDGYHMKTVLLLDEGNYDEAIPFAKSASERFPGDAELYYDYVHALALGGQLDESLKALESAKKLKFFEDAKAKFTLLEAQLQAENANIDAAIASCKECIALETEDAPQNEARFMLINLLLTVPNYEEALENAEAIINKNENDSFYFAALYFKPFCQKRLGKDAEAAANYKEAIMLYRLATLKNSAAVEAYLYRIMCLRDTEQFDKALELLDFMENLNANIAEIYTLRADIYKQTGKETLEKEALEKAYELKPELKNIFGEAGK